MLLGSNCNGCGEGKKNCGDTIRHGKPLDESGAVERSRPMPDSDWEAEYCASDPFKYTMRLALCQTLEGGVPGVDAPVLTNFGTYF
jgi:hypothetical protein